MSSNGYVIPVDPAELANRFAAPDSQLDDESDENEGIGEEELDALFTLDDYETKILPLLDLIPHREADLIELYYVGKKRQADLATIFSVTQAAISYSLGRGIQRIKFLLSIPEVTESEMRADLAVTFTQIDVDILVGMWRTTCQTKVATDLNKTQGQVRHRFFKAVKRLKTLADENDRYVPYHKIFSAISSKRFNILKAVVLPQWADKGIDQCV